MITGSEIYQARIEPYNTSLVKLARSEAVSIIPLNFRAGLTDRQITRFLSRIPAVIGCREWSAGRFKKGYGMFNAGRWPDGRQDTRYAHRVVWELIHGPIPEGLVVRHSCDNPPCCNPAHLLIGTQSDNLMDASVRGRLPKTRRPRAYDASVLRQAMKLPPRSVFSFAREHGIAPRTLAAAVRRHRRLEATHG
jgi:hypothetical protein